MARPRSGLEARTAFTFPKLSNRDLRMAGGRRLFASATTSTVRASCVLLQTALWFPCLELYTDQSAEFGKPGHIGQARRRAREVYRASIRQPPRTIRAMAWRATASAGRPDKARGVAAATKKACKMRKFGAEIEICRQHLLVPVYCCACNDV
jgi:hypothetical protein